MKTNRNHKNHNLGFSLVEVLVVIAVIGILAGIAIGAMSNTNETAKTNAAKRNAQTLCSLYSSARSVGALFSSNTKEGILDELIEGRNGADLSGSTFKMSPLGVGDKTAALAYCAFDSATESLTYHDDGVLEEGPVVEDEGWSEWFDWYVVQSGNAEQALSEARALWTDDGYQFQGHPVAGQPGLTQLQYRYHF